MKNMKIAHISDIHLTSFLKKNNLEKTKQLLNYTIKQKFDHMIISGDLTHNAGHEDFETLRELFRKLDLLHSERLTLVIGNHDIFGGPETAEDIFTFPEKCKSVDYDLKVKEFGDYYFEAFEDCIYKEKDNYFPFAKSLGDNLIIGMNSIAKYSKLKNPFASNGEVSLDEFNKLIGILNKHGNNYARRLLIIHHHFNKINFEKNTTYKNFWDSIEKQTMKLRKKKRLFQLFRTHNIDIVLHGHLHESMEYFRKGTRFLNSGGSLIGPVKDELAVNFINIKHSGITVEIHKILSDSSLVIENKVTERNPELLKVNENQFSL
jgi:3',5'-cyclic AMP phosphodiesterase CpdA